MKHTSQSWDDITIATPNVEHPMPGLYTMGTMLKFRT